MAERVASCACGQLSIRCVGEPAKVSLCHCLQCQRRSGSSFGIAAFFPVADVRAQGRSQAFTRQADSGFDVTFQFCPVCGSTVHWQAQRLPGMIGVAVGAFADPGFPMPTQQVHAQHRHAWVALSP